MLPLRRVPGRLEPGHRTDTRRYGRLEPGDGADTRRYGGRVLPLRRVSVRPDHDPGSWYWQVPAIGQLREKGLDLDSGVTVLVGENGSGKSTLVEALAAAWRGRLTGAEVTHWGPVWTPDDEGRPGYTDLGIAARDWEELDPVRDWRGFLAAPRRWLRHLSG